MSNKTGDILSDLIFEVAETTSDGIETTFRLPLWDCGKLASMPPHCTNEIKNMSAASQTPARKRHRRSMIHDDNELDEGHDRRVITLVTTGETPLGQVGSQLWRGALLIADLLIAQRGDIFGSSTVVVELGCGVGILGVVCRLVTNRPVFLTDKDEGGILSLAQRNMKVNAHLQPLRGASAGVNNVRIRELDWLSGEASRLFSAKTAPSTSASPANNNEFSWSSEAEELALLKSKENDVVVLVADCVYDEELTDSLFECLRAIFRCHPRGKCFLSLEKRFNFELASLSVQAYGYRRFLEHLGIDDECKNKSACNNGESRAEQPGAAEIPPHQFGGKHKPEHKEKIVLKGRRMSIESIPQCLEYRRVEQLELWEITRELGY